MAELSNRDAQFREMSLNGNIWKLIMKVSIPLSIYFTVSSIIEVFEMMMASHISAMAISATTYLSQLLGIVRMIGVGLAAGCCVKISESYGAGKYDLVKKQLSTLIAMSLILCAVIVLFVPFAPLTLRLIGTPESFISIGIKFFNVKLVATILAILNTVYIGIEKSRGNSKKLLILNMGAAIVQVSFTAFFVYGLKCDLWMIALPSVISGSIILIISIFTLCLKKDAFSFSVKEISLTKKIAFPLLKISFPVIAEKAFFQVGRSIMNGLASSFSDLTVGALGLSNSINGIPYQAQTGFQDGGSAIISQNRGAGNYKRTVQIFWRIMIVNLIIGLIIWILLNVFFTPISSLFANSSNGNDPEFQKLLISIFRWDSLGSCVPMGVTIACFALLMGYGKTKEILVVNIFRIFVYRIPVLFLLKKFTDLGPQATGVVMGLSNTLTAIHIFIVSMIVIKKINN